MKERTVSANKGTNKEPKQDYAEYRQIRKEKEELLIAKRTVETILNIDRQKEQEKEKEKEEKKNFR